MLYLFLIVGLPILLAAIFGVVRGIILFAVLVAVVMSERRAAERHQTAPIELAPCVIQLYFLLLPIFIGVQILGRDMVMVFCGGVLVGILALGFIKGGREGD